MRRLLVLILSFALAGCMTPTTPRLSSGATMQQDLEKRGVSVIVLGDQILIVMPSSLIFEQYSSKIKPSAYSTLNLVTCYINNYTKMLVNVGAYTADTGSCRVDLALSKEQAQHVARYLYDAGLDARVLHSVGYGGKRLVQKNSSDWDFNMNYRIEITLEKLYV